MSRSAIHSWKSTNDGSICYISSMWSTPSLSSTQTHHERYRNCPHTQTLWSVYLISSSSTGSDQWYSRILTWKKTALTYLPISFRISRNRDFSISCGLWWKPLVSRVELPVHVHTFVRSLKLVPWETNAIKHTFVNQQWCGFSSHSFSLLPDLLFSWVYLNIHRAIYGLFPFFLPMTMTAK